MKIVFIGSGNVATHLSKAFHAKGLTILQVFSPTYENAKKLGTVLDAEFISSIFDLNKSADIYIYATKDSSILDLCKQVVLPASAIQVHTAGSLAMDSFNGLAQRYGVFYPLQTFSKLKEVDFSTVPICIEACNPEVEAILVGLAKIISDKVYLVNSEQRKKIHLAAVFACNFTNYMYDLASQVMADAKLDFEILKPLIAETASKIERLSPYEAQTGPAVRFDANTIRKHLSLLNEKHELYKLYNSITNSIYERHRK